jgi:hypothetical protein
LTVLDLLHENHRIQDPRHGSTSKESRPDDSIRASQVVEKLRRSVYSVSSEEYIQFITAYEWRSAGVTEMFKMRPVLMYASLKVIDPRVNQEH